MNRHSPDDNLVERFLELSKNANVLWHLSVQRIVQSKRLTENLYRSIKRHVIEPALIQKEGSGWPYPLPQRGELRGEYIQGICRFTGHPILETGINKLRISNTFGVPGSGKSYSNKLEVLCANRAEIPVVKFDPRDDDLDLSGVVPDGFFIDAKEHLRLNPTIPPCPEFPSDALSNLLVKAFCNAYNLHEKSQALFRRGIEDYQKESGKQSFHLKDLLEYLEARANKLSSHARQSYDPLLVKLDSMVRGLGNILSNDTMSIEDLFSQKLLVISLTRLNHNERMFLYSYLLGARIWTGIFKGMRGDTIRCLVITDEAEEFISKTAAYELGEVPEIVTVLNYSRDAGLALSFTSHNASELIGAAAQSSIIVAFRTGSYQDLDHIGGMMAIEYKDRGLLTQLKHREFILKTPQFTYPIPGYMPQLNIPSKPDWKVIEESRKRFAGAIRMVHAPMGAIHVGMEKGKRGKGEGLEQEAVRVIHENPFMPRKHLYRVLGIGVQKGTNLITSLKEKGVLEEVEIDPVVKGGKRKVLFVKEHVRKALGLRKQRRGRGSIRSQLIVHLIREELEKHKEIENVEVEYPLDEQGSCADLMAELEDGRRVALEFFHLENRAEVEKAVLKNRKHGFARTVVVVERQGFAKTLSPGLQEDVHAVSLDEFFEKGGVEKAVLNEGVSGSGVSG